MKPCMTLEARWVKKKRPCVAITTWLLVILPLYEELVTLVHDTLMENTDYSKGILMKAQFLHAN